jgi:hypothetical protein
VEEGEQRTAGRVRGTAASDEASNAEIVIVEEIARRILSRNSSISKPIPMPIPIQIPTDREEKY